MRVVQKPNNFTDMKANVSYVFSLLKALEIDIAWEVDELLTVPDTDFVLLQLTYIYEALKNKQGVLPPASGREAGYTSGPNGETLVVGMVFADTNPVLKILPAVERGSKTIVLGAGYHDIPFTPIDSTAAEDAQAALNAKLITQLGLRDAFRDHTLIAGRLAAFGEEEIAEVQHGLLSFQGRKASAAPHPPTIHIHHRTIHINAARTCQEYSQISDFG
jgi:hypothetical protein